MIVKSPSMIANFIVIGFKRRQSRGMTNYEEYFLFKPTQIKKPFLALTGKLQMEGQV